MMQEGMETVGMANVADLGGSFFNVAFKIVAGVIFAVFGVMVWMYRDRLKDARAMLAFFALLAVVPMGVMLVRQRTNWLPKAVGEVEVVALERKMMGPRKAVVYVTLSEPAFAYLEYTDLAAGTKKIVAGVGVVEKRYGHAFEIENVGARGGTARVAVNGKLTERMIKLP